MDGNINKDLDEGVGGSNYEVLLLKNEDFVDILMYAQSTGITAAL